MKVPIDELEIGPHFITFYSKKLPELLEAAKECRKLFDQKYPKLAKYQQENFEHEPNDPNVYHPFADPGRTKKSFRHFHVRYGYRPSDDEIKEIMDLFSKYLEYTDIFKITNLEDDKEEKYKNLEYPKIPRRGYLKWIDQLRTGEWRKGGK